MDSIKLGQEAQDAADQTSKAARNVAEQAPLEVANATPAVSDAAGEASEKSEGFLEKAKEELEGLVHKIPGLGGGHGG